MDFTTEKGTRLPLLDLRGKKYLQVAHRLRWFREEHPDWCIKTEVTNLSSEAAVVKCTIIDQDGKPIATGHKSETKQGFADYIEKAETGAIGRALAASGYGTQFAGDDFNEGDRLADAPLGGSQGLSSPVSGASPQFSGPPTDPNLWEVNFGKYKGMLLKDIPQDQALNYAAFLRRSDKPSKNSTKFVDLVDQLYNSPPIPEGIFGDLNQ